MQSESTVAYFLYQYVYFFRIIHKNDEVSNKCQISSSADKNESIEWAQNEYLAWSVESRGIWRLRSMTEFDWLYPFRASNVPVLKLTYRLFLRSIWNYLGFIFNSLLQLSQPSRQSCVDCKGTTPLLKRLQYSILPRITCQGNDYVSKCILLCTIVDFVLSY